jgi:hypothetical protein
MVMVMVKRAGEHDGYDMSPDRTDGGRVIHTDMRVYVCTVAGNIYTYFGFFFLLFLLMGEALQHWMDGRYVGEGLGSPGGFGHGWDRMGSDRGLVSLGVALEVWSG